MNKFVHIFWSKHIVLKSLATLFLAFIMFLQFSSCKKTELPATPGNISGAMNLCPGETNVLYSIQPVSGATYYLWTVPDGSKIISGQGSTTIAIQFGKHSGKITVRACNESENSLPSEIYVTQGGVVGQWCRELDFPNGIRSNAVSFSIGNKGYVGLGTDVSANKFADFWEFNPDENSWTQKADFAGGERFDAAGFSIGNLGYIGTGYNASSVLKDFWEYNPATNQWTRKADFAGGRRQLAFGLAIGNKGYIGSGRDTSFHVIPDFWEYNPQTDSWTQKNAAFSRQGAITFSINNKGYVGLGSVEIGPPQNDLWSYDPQTDTWTQLPHFPGSPRFAASGFALNSKGYITGGYDQQNNFNDFYSYNTLTNSWDSLPNFPGAVRAYSISFSIGNKGYFGIGSQGNNGTIALNDFWVYGAN